MKTACVTSNQRFGDSVPESAIKIGLTLLVSFMLSFVGLTTIASGHGIEEPAEESVELVIEEASESESVSDKNQSVVIRGVRLMLEHNVPIATREAGVVIELPVQEGQLVNSRQTVVQLDRETWQAQLDSTIQQLRIAKKESSNDIDVRYAKKSAAVNQKVLARSAAAANAYHKSISKTELERLQLELERSRLSAEQANHSQAVKQLTSKLREAEQRLAKIRLDERSIKSPIDGQVAELMVQVGQYVGAGQTVARVISLDNLKIEAFVDSDQVVKITQGQSAAIEASINGKTIRSIGKVRYVSPEIDPLNSDVRVVIDLDNSDRKLKPGMVVNVVIGN